MVKFVKIILIFGIVICSLSVQADIYLGANARSAAMAGVGIAIIPSRAEALNPATLSETGMRLKIQFPSLDMRTDGINLGEAFKMLGSTKISGANALRLAKDFGDSPASLDAHVHEGIGLPLSSVGAGAAITVKIVPDAAFQTWVKDGSVSLPPAGSKADVFGVGVTTMPEVAAGFKLPVKSDYGTFAIGVRVKPTSIYYSHYIADASSVIAGAATPADEMNGNKFLKKSSIGADIGLLYKSSVIEGFSIGAVSYNALAPKSISFGPDAPPEARRDPAPRTFSAGAAFQKSSLTVAVDFIDLSQKFGKTQMSAGAEIRLPLRCALRAGYNTVLGASVGVGIAGVDISYSGKASFVLSQMISFL